MKTNVEDEIRQHLKLVSGSRVEFVIDEEGQVKIFPLTVAVETLSGPYIGPTSPPPPKTTWMTPSLRALMIGTVFKHRPAVVLSIEYATIAKRSSLVLGGCIAISS
jgi:hypothetical protein